MSVGYGSEEFTLTVPDGVQGGDTIDVDLPVDEGAGGAGLSHEEVPSFTGNGRCTGWLFCW